MDARVGGGGPRRNRVTPTGEIVAIPLRGAWLGNRGVLHSDGEIVRSHRSQLWITCRLEFRGWRLPQWQPGHFTVLFFHDEAVSLAAGHRPCALCRREAYTDYRDRWAASSGGDLPSAKEMDRRLHAERNVRGTSRRRWHDADWADLPAGAFVLDDRPDDSRPAAALVLERTVVPWTVTGYGTPRRRPARGPVRLVTPPSTVDVLTAGYRPQIDPAALR